MAGIVLAGGQSRRLGTDKAAIMIDGERLIERAVRVLREVTQPVIVIADRANRYELRDGTPVICDDSPGNGPLGGIVTGLRVSGPGRHALLPCDMPFVSATVLRLLFDSAYAYDAAVPVIDGRMEPLCAVYDASCIGPFDAALKAGCRAVYRALEGLRVFRVEETVLRGLDPHLEGFTNLNCPDDLEQLGNQVSLRANEETDAP